MKPTLDEFMESQRKKREGGTTAAIKESIGRKPTLDEFMASQQAKREQRQAEAYASLFPAAAKREERGSMPAAKTADTYSGRGGKIDGGSTSVREGYVYDEKGEAAKVAVRGKLRKTDEDSLQAQTEAIKKGWTTEQWLADAEKKAANASETLKQAKAARDEADRDLNSHPWDYDAAIQAYLDEVSRADNAELAAQRELQAARRANYASLPQRQDYERLAAEGSAKEGNKVQAALADKDRLTAKADQMTMEEGKALRRALYMTEEERKTYSYLLARRGDDAADEFLADLDDTLNYREAGKSAADIEALPGVLRLPTEGLVAAASGFDNAFTGMAQNFSRDARPTTATAYQGQLVRQNIEKHDGPKLLGHSVEGIGYDAVNTMANMAPSLAAGAVTGGAGGALAMGLQAKGNAYKQALDEGYTRGQAEAYSTVMGAAEGGLQYLLGGFEKLGGISQFTGKMVSRIGNGTVRAMVDLGIDILGENTEEYLQNKIEPWMRNTIFGENNQIRLWDEEDAYTVLLTTITTGLMNAPGTAQEARIGKTGRQLRKTGKTDTLIEAAILSDGVDQTVARMAEDMKSGKTPVTDRSVGELAVAFTQAGGDLSALIDTEAVKTKQENAQSRTGNETADVANDAHEAAEDAQRAKLPQRSDLDEETRRKLQNGALTLGEDAATVVAAYHTGQNVDNYVAAMDAAINLYAANGVSLEVMGRSALTKDLTEDQIEAAWQRGQRAREAKIEQAKTQAAERELHELVRGRVRYAAVKIDGKSYQAANEKTMNRAQKRQIDACAAVAEETGLELVVYDGEDSGGTQGVYVRGGKIYLNANAGKGVGQTLIVQTLSHELTHFAEELGGEEYLALRDYAVEKLAEGNQERFEQIVEAKRKERGNISYDEAISEVVADGCEMMLRDSAFAERLALENPSLMQRIGEWISDFCAKIRAAFEGVSARHEEAQLLMEHAKELQTRWDKAVAAATKKLQETRQSKGSENAAEEIGGEGVQYSIEQIVGDSGKNYGVGVVLDSTLLDGLTDSERIEMVKLYIQSVEGQSFIAYDSSNNPVDVKVEESRKFFENSNGKRVSVNKDLSTKYRQDKTKQESIVLIDELISSAQKRAETASKHSHDWLDDNGKNNWEEWNVIVQDKQRAVWNATLQIATTASGEKVLYDIFPIKKVEQPGNSGTISTTSSKAQTGTNVKSKNTPRQSSEDSGVTDRELLREAAGREGASEELVRYGKKADNLEAYQRRLERQQKKLGELEEEAKSFRDAERLQAARERGEKTIKSRTKTLKEKTAARDELSEKVDERVRRLATAEPPITWARRMVQDLNELTEDVDKAEKRLNDAKNEQAKLSGKNGMDSAKARQNAKETSELKERIAETETLIEKTERALARLEASGPMQKEAAEARERWAENNLPDAVEAAREIQKENRELREALTYMRAMVKKTTPGKAVVDRGDARRLAKAIVKEHESSADAEYIGDGIIKLADTILGRGGMLGANIEEMREIQKQSRQIARVVADNVFRTETDEEGTQREVYGLSKYGREAVIETVAQEIEQAILSGDLREAETIADQNYIRMQKMVEESKAKLAEAKEREKTAKGKLAAERRARDEIIRERVKLQRERIEESREARQTRINIERQRARLSRMLRENSRTRHIPDGMKESVGRFIQSLDTLGPFYQGTKAEARRMEELKDIERALSHVVKSEELDLLCGGNALSESIKELLQNDLDTVTRAIDQAGEKRATRLMTLKELRALEETLNIITTAVNNANKLLAEGKHRGAKISELAEGTIEENRKLPAKTSKDGIPAKLLNWYNLMPYYAFKRFGESGQKIFYGIARGWGTMARHVKEIIKFTKKTYTAKEVKAWEKNTHTFQLVDRDKAGQNSTITPGDTNSLRADAEPVTMTEAQMMLLYALNKREQARGHLFGSGIRLDGGKKKSDARNWLLLDISDMAAITSQLSERQIEVADALVEYMSTVGSRWGNEVTRRRYGIDMFTEENYVPIKTDSNGHDAKTPESSQGNLFRLSNQSFTKKTVKNASDAIVIGSIFDVFSDHMADMAKYNAMALPMEDAMRWYNYQAESTSVQQSIERAFGAEAGKYFINFMKDLNGVSEGGRGEDLFGKMASRVKVAAVAANVRVALQQPTSIARAALLLHPKYLVKGAAIKGGREKALKYSGLAVWKDLGYFDLNVNAGMREQIKNAGGLVEKIQDKSMWLAEQGDQLTWGALWNACELETRDKTGLDGEELMQKTAERFDEVILATQVMDSTLTRSHIMRSKSSLVKEFTAFMAESTLTYNTLLDCYSEFQKAKGRDGAKVAVQKMKGLAILTAAVYCMNAALTGVAQAIADAGRDDDDYETWLQKFWQHWKEDAADNMNPLKLVPYIQDLYNLAKGRDKDLLVLQPAKQFGEILTIWYEWYKVESGQQAKATKTTWYGNMTMYGKVYKTLQLLSSASGLPLGAATREFQAGYNTFLRPMLNETWGEVTGKELPKWRTYDGGPERQIKSAWENKILDDEAARQLLIDEGEAKDDTAAKKIIYGWVLAGTPAYKAVKEAACKGDADGYKAAMAAMTEAGYKEEDVQREVRTAIKQQYQAPESGLKLSKAYCIDYLMRFGGMRREEATATAQEWTCYIVTGIQFGDIAEKYVDGDISKYRAEELLQTYGGKRKDEAAAKVREWTCYKDTGIKYGELKEAYIAGEITAERAAELRKTYGGYLKDQAAAKVREWTCYKDTGIDYDELKEAYIADEITRERAEKLKQTYGGKSETAAKEWGDKMQFEKENPAYDDISESAAAKYFSIAVPAKISSKLWYEFWDSTKNLESDDNSTKREKIVAIINSLQLSKEQKDALYLAKGYSESSLRNTPWHR